MDSLTFLERLDKAKPQALYVLHGDEQFLKRQVQQAITSQVRHRNEVRRSERGSIIDGRLEGAISITEEDADVGARQKVIRVGHHDIEMAVVTAMPESGDRVSKLEQPKQGVVMAVAMAQRGTRYPPGTPCGLRVSCHS